jgi:hypothetical protein
MNRVPSISNEVEYMVSSLKGGVVIHCHDHEDPVGLVRRHHVLY